MFCDFQPMLQKLIKVVAAFAVALGVLFFVCQPAWSQGNFGRIVGGVTDQNGGVVVGASVTVLDVQRGVTRTLMTDDAGQYSAPSLVPGQYQVTVDSMGFNKFERRNIGIEVGQEVRVDAVLTPGSQTQTITVTEELPAITTTNATLGGVIENQALVELPLSGRNFLHLLDLKPGIQMRPGGGPNSYVSNGQRNNLGWMLDGLFSGNLNTGASPVLGGGSGAGGPEQANVLPVDSIQEINVMQNPKAEYGYKPGTSINIGLKSGTNSFHGSAYAFGRDQGLEAKNAFSTSKLPTEVEQWGVSTGGPIKKDKIFFFGNFEKQDFAQTVTKQAQIPTTAAGLGTGTSLPDAIADLNARGIAVKQLSLNLAGCTNPATHPTSAALISCDASKGILGNSGASGNKDLPFAVVGGSNNFVAKVDYNVNDRNTIHGEYVFGDGSPIGQNGIITQPYWRGPYHIKSQVGRAGWTWTPNSSWVNEARFGYDRLLQDANAGDCFPSQFGSPDFSALGWNSGVQTCGFMTLTITGFTPWGSNLGTHSQPVFFQGEDAVSRTLGKHSFRFAAGLRSVEWQGNRTNTLRGTLSFTSLENFLSGTPNTSTTANSLSVGNPNQDIVWKSYWTYFQDDWRLTPKITLNLGLRWEYESPMSDTQNNAGGFDPSSPTGMFQQASGQGLWKSSKKDFAPRLGIAWDVTGKGTTVVRAGGGVFYNPFITQLVSTQQTVWATPTGATLFLTPTQSIQGPGDMQNGTVSVPASAIAANWAPNTPIFGTIPTTAKLSCSSTAPCALSVIDPSLKPAIVGMWNLDIQHAISNTMSFSIAYVGNHGEWGTGNIDVNQPTPGVKANEQARRPYTQFPFLGQISTEVSSDRSNYHSLQVGFTKRVSHGLSFTSGYTYGHALDIHSLDGAASPKGVMDSNHPGLDYGSGDLDFRQRFTLSGTYVIPGKKSPLQLLEGWQLNTSLTFLSGQPFYAYDSSNDLSGTGELVDRWNMFGNPNDFKGVGTIGGIPCYGVAGSTFAKASNCTTVASIAAMPQACVTAATSVPVNPLVPSSDPNSTGLKALQTFGCYAQGDAVIVPPAQGTFGNMPRNVLTGDPHHFWDLSITKNWRIKERVTAQFRAEIFNAANIVNYSVPTAVGSKNPGSPAAFAISPGTPDVINNAPVFGTGGPRKIQLGAKFIF